MEEKDSDNYKLIGAGNPKPLYFNLEISIIPFYYPGMNTSYDDAFKSGYLGNFYELKKDSIFLFYYTYHDPPTLKEFIDQNKIDYIIKIAPTTEFDKYFTKYFFNNVEAAFQASKYSYHWAAKFQDLNGNEALDKGIFYNNELKKRGYKPDKMRPGYDQILLLYFNPIKQQGEETKFSILYENIINNYTIMRYLLKQKFNDPILAEKLMSTSGKFLLEHKRSYNSEKHEKTWSDNNNGTGQNWLGFVLMFLRFELLKKKEKPETDNLEHIINKHFRRILKLDHKVIRTHTTIQGLIKTAANQINIDYPEKSDPSVIAKAKAKAKGKGKGKK